MYSNAFTRRLFGCGLALALGLPAAMLQAGEPAPHVDSTGHVLVAGATGRTGRLIVEELRANGYTVRALVRDIDSARARLGDGIEYAEGDVRDRDSIDAALTDIDILVSSVGATRDDPQNFPEFVDYGGVRNLAEAAGTFGLAHFVLVSSSGVTQEDHFLNRNFNNVLIWKARGEETLRESGVTYTIIRPGGLIDEPGGQTPLRFEQGDTGIGMIPRADVARVAVAALGEPAARNRTFELFGGDAGTMDDWPRLFGALEPDPD